MSYKPTICTGNSSCGGELTWCREEERKEEKCPFRFAHCPGIRSNKKGGNRSKSISGQCVEATKLEDGEVSDCLDRSDEQVFQEGKDSTFKEAAIINLDKLQFCTGESGGWKYLGLDCGEPEEWPFPCMPMFFWCQDFLNLKCPVLGTNSTDIYTNNPTICANTTFWREKNCGKWDGEDLIRCTGNLTGQCVSKSFAKDWRGGDASCRDGSDKYRPIKQTVIKEEKPNHQTTSHQTWKTRNKDESDPFKVPPSETLPKYALSSDDYIKDETTNLMMAAPTEETCKDNEGFSCQGRLCDCACYDDNDDDKANTLLMNELKPSNKRRIP